MPQLTPQQPPPPDYYAGNLRVMLTHVADGYEDLLDAEERRFIGAVLALSSDAQRLYARLLSRKGPWIRIDKLCYREIDDLPGAIDELAARGLAAVNGPAPADALLGLLTQAERQLCFPTILAASRTRWIEQCVSRFPDQRIRQRLAGCYPWIALNDYQLIGLCQLLFFGDERQDLSAFVLQDLGLVRFERYPLGRARRLFADRQALDRFRRLRYLSGLSHRLGEMPELAPWLLESLWIPALSRHEQRQVNRTLNRLGRWYERRGDFEGALASHARSKAHPSRERRVRLLKKLGDECGSETLRGRMGAAPRSAEEEDFAARFGHRARRLRHQETRLTLADPPAAGIEAHAADQIGASGAAVFHLENSFPLSLTGLAFWDVLFADLPGAFSHPFQSAPLDLFWPDFAESRQALIDEQLQRLAAPGGLEQALRDTFQAKQGIANRLVSWRHFSETMLELTLENIPSAALLALVGYVIRWPYRTRNGFPDLVVIYGRGNYEFVEVKGPTDQLQPAQRIWLKALAELGLPARVLKYRAC